MAEMKCIVTLIDDTSHISTKRRGTHEENTEI